MLEEDFTPIQPVLFKGSWNAISQYAKILTTIHPTFNQLCVSCTMVIHTAPIHDTTRTELDGPEITSGLQPSFTQIIPFLVRYVILKAIYPVLILPSRFFPVFHCPFNVLLRPFKSAFDVLSPQCWIFIWLDFFHTLIFKGSMHCSWAYISTIFSWKLSIHLRSCLTPSSAKKTMSKPSEISAEKGIVATLLRLLVKGNFLTYFNYYFYWEIHY